MNFGFIIFMAMIGMCMPCIARSDHVGECIAFNEKRSSGDQGMVEHPIGPLTFIFSERGLRPACKCQMAQAQKKYMNQRPHYCSVGKHQVTSERHNEV